VKEEILKQMTDKFTSKEEFDDLKERLEKLE
jgi:hypothetical protein